MYVSAEYWDVVRDDMESDSHDIQEQGHNYSWVDLITLLFEVFKYLLKKELYFKQFFLKNINFSSCRIPENKESVSLTVPNEVMPHTDYTMSHCIQTVFYSTRYLFLIVNVYDNSHLYCPWPLKDPAWLWGTKVNVILAFYTAPFLHWNSNISLVIRWSLMLPMTWGGSFW